MINLSVLLILKGEHGIECLLCCSIDGKRNLFRLQRALVTLCASVLVNSLVLAIITKKEGEAASFPFLFGQTFLEQEGIGSTNYTETPLALSTSRPQYTDRKGSDATGKEEGDSA